jgi:Domain of unknown function (DUF932)
MMYQRQLSIDEIQHKAPSVFSDTAAESTSNRYLHIPTSRILEGLIKADFIPVAAKQTRAKATEHAKHVIHFSHKSMADKLSNQGEIPLIRVQNSHDGKSSFQIDTGFYRLVCSNGLVMPGEKFNSAKVIHKIGMEDDVIQASYRILESFDTQTKRIEAMKSVHLLPDELTLLQDSAARLVFDAEVIDANKERGHNVGQRLSRARRSADMGFDLWKSFNRIQENAIKGGQRVYTASGNYRAMREVNSIDREKQINVELMLLAQKMAELKGVSLAA